MPGATDAPTVSVSVEELPAVTVAGLKLAVAPAGRPEALSATDCAASTVTAVEIVDVPLAPCAKLTLAGAAETEKSVGAAVTVSVTVVVWVALVPLPTTVSVYVPGAVAAPAVTVIVDEPPAVMLDGAKPTVVPAGAPVALKETLCADPFVTAVETVDFALAPCTTLTVVGLAASEKSDDGAAETVSATVVVCVALVPVPVTVTVYVPAGVLGPAVSVSTEELPAATDAGLNDAVAPAGRPLAESATACGAPPVTDVEIVEVPADPAGTVTADGLAESEKSDGLVEQPGNLNEAIRVCQLNSPVVARYSVVYQKVQSSLGSTDIIE